MDQLPATFSTETAIGETDELSGCDKDHKVNAIPGLLTFFCGDWMIGFLRMDSQLARNTQLEKQMEVMASFVRFYSIAHIEDESSLRYAHCNLLTVF